LAKSAKKRLELSANAHNSSADNNAVNLAICGGGRGYAPWPEPACDLIYNFS
jgi:hypothetical protein